jgi:tetratricopeptide (TPR) repeat protein
MLSHIRDLSRAEFDITLEQAQIEFDRGDSQDALAILTHHTTTSVRKSALLSEIYLSIGDLSRSDACIRAAIADLEDDHHALGRLRSIQARILASQGDKSGAMQAFEMALTLLEREGDRFGLARCKTNLAALLIEQKQDFDGIQRLLQDAEAIQVLLKDAVGLMTTRNNLEALYRRWI